MTTTRGADLLLLVGSRPTADRVHLPDRRRALPLVDRAAGSAPLDLRRQHGGRAPQAGFAGVEWGRSGGRAFRPEQNGAVPRRSACSVPARHDGSSPVCIGRSSVVAAGLPGSRGRSAASIDGRSRIQTLRISGSEAGARKHCGLRDDAKELNTEAVRTPMSVAEIDEGVFEATATIDNGSFGTRTIRFETGRLAQQAAGAVVAYLDDETMLLSATTASKASQGALRLLPAHHRRRGADVRRGPDPRLVLPSRGPSVHRRDPHLPADRPAAAPDVRLRPAQRDPGRGHDPEPGSQRSLRRAGDQRRVGVHPDRRPAVLRPGRRRAGGADRRPVGWRSPPSSSSKTLSSTWSWPAASCTMATSRS